MNQLWHLFWMVLIWVWVKHASLVWFECQATAALAFPMTGTKKMFLLWGTKMSGVWRVEKWFKLPEIDHDPNSNWLCNEGNDQQWPDSWDNGPVNWLKKTATKYAVFRWDLKTGPVQFSDHGPLWGILIFFILKFFHNNGQIFLLFRPC